MESFLLVSGMEGLSEKSLTSLPHPPLYVSTNRTALQKLKHQELNTE